MQVVGIPGVFSLLDLLRSNRIASWFDSTVYPFLTELRSPVGLGSQMLGQFEPFVSKSNVSRNGFSTEI